MMKPFRLYFPLFYSITHIFLFLVFLLSSCDSKGTTKDAVNILITRDGLKNMELALDLYKQKYGEYPVSLDELLVKSGIEETSIIEDAWGRNYHYLKIRESYELFSVGRDGKPYTKDDVKLPHAVQ
jgi:hypothetical protein